MTSIYVMLQRKLIHSGFIFTTIISLLKIQEHITVFLFYQLIKMNQLYQSNLDDQQENSVYI